MNYTSNNRYYHERRYPNRPHSPNCCCNRCCNYMYDFEINDPYEPYSFDCWSNQRCNTT